MGMRGRRAGWIGSREVESRWDRRGGEPPLALHGHRESDEQEKKRRRTRKMRLYKGEGKWGRKELRSKQCRLLKEEEEELKTSLNI